jgi:hypothetical protein
MHTEDPIIMATKNSVGEHLDNVDILLAITEETATINIHAITSERAEDGTPQESTGRLLLTMSAPSDDCNLINDARSYRHLDEALEDGWYITQKTERLIRAAAAAGLEVVRNVDCS